MKIFETKVVIVDKDKAAKILLNKNVTFSTQLNNKYILKYNGNMDTEILAHFLKLEKIASDLDDENENENAETRKLNYYKQLNKGRGMVSSIPIASFITAMAQISYLQLKNDPNNNLIYSDTDSFYMEHPLPDEMVDGAKLGSLKLENVIKEGIFISPKFYTFTNDKGQTIFKSKGVHQKHLTLESYEDLYQGKSLTVEQTVFKLDVMKGTIKIISRPYTITGSLLNNTDE
jgi:hypothetical protein